MSMNAVMVHSKDAVFVVIKSQIGSLESLILDGAKHILWYSSKTCNKAMSRGDVDLNTMQSHSDRANLGELV